MRGRTRGSNRDAASESRSVVVAKVEAQLRCMGLVPFEPVGRGHSSCVYASIADQVSLRDSTLAVSMDGVRKQLSRFLASQYDNLKHLLPAYNIRDKSMWLLRCKGYERWRRGDDFVFLAAATVYTCRIRLVHAGGVTWQEPLHAGGHSVQTDGRVMTFAYYTAVDYFHVASVRPAPAASLVATMPVMLPSRSGGAAGPSCGNDVSQMKQWHTCQNIVYGSDDESSHVNEDFSSTLTTIGSDFVGEAEAPTDETCSRPDVTPIINFDTLGQGELAMPGGDADLAMNAIAPKANRKRKKARCKSHRAAHSYVS